ncbi:MAG: hypothetical protein RLZZ491_834 [Pseudomonadota bacterium]
MIRSQKLQMFAAFGLALGLCLATASALAVAMERRSIDAVHDAMREGGMDWVTVSADGLQVFLDGTAPNEAAAFRAGQRAASLVDGDRVISRILVAQRADLQPPRFSVDILRARDGIQVIGLVPAATGLEPITATIGQIADGVEVTNLVETTDFPVPALWDVALGYGLAALELLPRSKITIRADRVEVQAIAESAAQRATFLTMLDDMRPDGLEVALDISAPRPVITPFQLRFTMDQDGARLETCAADSPAAQQQILAAAIAAGAPGTSVCNIGLGVPSPQWAEAVVVAIRAVADLGAGTVAFSDGDVTLIAADGTGQDDFDRVIGELANALPDVFSLSGVLNVQNDTGSPMAGPARLIATLDDTGRLILRGRLPEGTVGQAVEAYARALFGQDRADVATRMVEDLPIDWAVRAMIGLDALAQLNEGTMTLEPETLVLRGRTGNAEAESDLSRFLGEQLGQDADFQLRISYMEALDPVASLPSPEECIARIAEIQRDTKITFDPGSVAINAAAGAVLDRIATVLPECRHVRMEIAGHTDSQGREEMNLNLSQSRANAVLDGLLARNVLVSNLTAQGYGESQPIASNETEAGREQNRRIEFRALSTASDDSADSAATEASEAAATAGPLADADASATTPVEPAPGSGVPRPVPRPERARD